MSENFFSILLNGDLATLRKRNKNYQELRDDPELDNLPVAPHPLTGDAAGVSDPGVEGVEGELVPPQRRGGGAGQEGMET